jgi:hypothetical protein
MMRGRITLRCLLALAFVLPFVSSEIFLLGNVRADDSRTDVVGPIEGAAIQVSGPMTVEVVNGQTKTILRSGSDVRVKSGTARINLAEGGELTICGPAHFSILKSGGAITVALDSGMLHAHVGGDTTLNIYTPQIQAKPIAVGDAMEDVFVGVSAGGELCVRANRGAVRIEQQLTGQSVIVPQGGDVLLTNGQLEGLRNTPGGCVCESAASDSSGPEMSRLATTEEIRQSAGGKKQNISDTNRDTQVATPTEKQEPIYQVFMPPLRFDASAKIQPEPDARMIVLVRRIRVRPTLIFQGRVEGQTVAAKSTPPQPSAPVRQNKPAEPAKSQNDSVITRVRKFFHSLWSSNS